jgi:hypothetical protein
MPGTLGIKIFLFCELIVAARLLLFEIPVFLDRFFGASKAAGFSSVDRFQVVIIFVSIFYLAASGAALLGHAFWRPLHYLTTALAVILTLSFCFNLQKLGQPVETFYYFPVVCSIVTSLVVFFYRENSLQRKAI